MHDLGAPVTFTRTLHRHQRWEEKERRTVKRWEPFTYRGDRDPEPRRGILVGLRVLQNGHADYIGYEEGTVWTGTFRFTAYLIAFDLRRKPVLCLPEHVTFLEEQLQLVEEPADGSDPIPGLEVPR